MSTASSVSPGITRDKLHLKWGVDPGPSTYLDRSINTSCSNKLPVNTECPSTTIAFVWCHISRLIQGWLWCRRLHISLKLQIYKLKHIFESTPYTTTLWLSEHSLWVISRSPLAFYTSIPSIFSYIPFQSASRKNVANTCYGLAHWRWRWNTLKNNMMGSTAERNNYLVPLLSKYPVLEQSRQWHLLSGGVPVRAEGLKLPRAAACLMENMVGQLVLLLTNLQPNSGVHHKIIGWNISAEM
jgi:hypothetical protein